MIGRCDFRTTVSRYTTSTNSPWVITVGETAWHRHLIVENVSDSIGNFDATLAILPVSESGKFGYDIRHDKIDKRIQLSDLIARKYIGVKRTLFPSKRENPSMTLAQAEKMFLGKRLRIVDSEPDVFGDCTTGVAKELFHSSNDNFAVRLEMDEAFMGQKMCTVGFTVESATPTYVEGPLLAGKGGTRKIEVIE